ncbi:hypothetical protein ES332_D13G260100v1 [Gossypium tomentosum]|uniref:Uncharacterized protein n=1 Tax=Gossypium tomentosum TaxID=34277 RepID=A0A5D2I353_GOSTO|nr:hypothetical protein ES332_D13G260100v1 [Gossypium tomentosum]
MKPAWETCTVLLRWRTVTYIICGRRLCTSNMNL